MVSVAEVLPLVIALPELASLPSPFLVLILDLSVVELDLVVAFAVPVSVPFSLGDFDLPFVEVVPVPFLLDP